MTRVLIANGRTGTDIARALGLGPQGEIYLAGVQKLGIANAQFSVQAFLADGTVNTGFGSNGWVATGFVNAAGAALGEARGEAMAVDAQGNVLVAGSVYNPFSGFLELALARWTSSGALDTSFSADGRLTLDLSQRDDKAQAVSVLADGSILVAGLATDRNGNSNLSLVRLNPNGTLDSRFGTGGAVQTDLGWIDSARSLLVQPDGKILLAGTTSLQEGRADWMVARYHANGTLDTSFAGTGYRLLDLGQGVEEATSLALQDDPLNGLRILVSGYSVSADGVSTAALMRLNANGSTDTSFGTNGSVLLTSSQGDARAWGLAVQPDGHLVLAGSADGDMALFRFTADGAIDTRVDGGRTLLDFPSGSNESISDAAFAVATRGDLVLAAGSAWSGTELDMGLALLIDNHLPVGKPIISGTVRQYEQLSAQATEITDADGLGAFSWQWLANGVPISGATGTTLDLTQDHVGKRISARVGYTDGLGNPEWVLSTFTLPVENVDEPASGTLSLSGSPMEGGQLNLAISQLQDGDGPVVSTSVFWQAQNGATWQDLLGPTGGTLAIPADQSYVGLTVRARVITTDVLGGNTELISNALSIQNVDDPTIATVVLDGLAQEGGSLTATARNASDEDGGIASWSVVWQSVVNGSWTTLPEIVGSTLAIASDQSMVGRSYRVIMTSTDAFGAQAVFASSPVVIANVNDAPTGGVTIGGAPVQGRYLRVADNLADEDGLDTITYTWRADGAPVATGSSLLLTQAHVGKAITVVASYTDQKGFAEAVSSQATALVANVNDGPTGSVLIAGTLAQGQTLSATNTLADVDGMGTVVYTWRAGTEVVGTGASLLLTQAHVGRAITLTARYTDLQGTAEEVASAASTPVANVNDAPTGGVLIGGNATQ
ncbi:MAG: hypothetical protein RIQ97_1294, partial [Pseudomonadota bacterium]